MVVLQPPADMFGREFEWSALSRFATDPRCGATLGVVSGRWRQGKTFLLMALCRDAGGFYFAAEEAADGESLRRLGKALAEHLGAPAPLAFAGWHEAVRGRAGLELVVPTLDHRLAARFWGLDDPVTALRVNAVVGGTPAYRREFARDDAPSSPDDFDPWVVRTVLSPASPLFREARYLLADEPDLRDAGIYHSVLAAIAAGNATRGGIASYVGRRSGDLAHPLAVLQDCGLVSREPDVFRDRRSQFRIAEPLITFYHAVMRPVWAELEHTRDATRLWRRSRRRFLGTVLGPHFEHVCRYWTHFMAPPDLFGDHPARVGRGTVNDPANRTSHEVDVVAFDVDEDGREPLLAVGEAKWGEVMGLGHVERLRRVRALLVEQGRPGARTAKLVCYGGAGFTADRAELSEQDDDVVLVGLADLYRDR